MAVRIAKADGCPCEPGPAPVNRGAVRDLVLNAPAANVEGLYRTILHYEASEYGPQLITLYNRSFSTFGANGGNDESSPLVRVTYGTGGVTDDVELAVGRGTTLVVNAESIDIEARLQASPREFRSMLVGAVVLSGHGHASPAPFANTRSFPFFTLAAAGGSANFVIPKFARGFYLFSVDDAGYTTTMQVDWFADEAIIGTLLTSRDLAVAAPGAGGSTFWAAAAGGWAMPPNARSVRVTNNAGATVRSFVPVFYLGI